jgi:aminopeptidase N
VKNLTRAQAEQRAALLDVASYDVLLDVSADDSECFSSSVEVRFACRTPGASTFVELDAELLSASLNGRPVEAGDGNRIALTDLAADNVLTVDARCTYSRSGEGLHRFVDPADGRVYVYAQSFLDDAQRMFACFDQPDLKAVFRLTVVAPHDWTVLANARSEQRDGRWVFAPTERISTYLFHVSAGPWHGRQEVYDGIELGVWCRQSLAEHLDADEMLEVTRQCLDLQQELFGRRYPFGDTYDQVFVPEFNAGAMENPGCVTFTEDLLFRSRVTEGRRRMRAMVVAHEMSHMWFGDLVTMRWWDDLWLNESFAELMGYLSVDRTTRFEDTWTDFCTSRKAWGYRADALPTTHPVAGSAQDARSALLDFDGISYAKGASVLRQLMATMGEDAFFGGVRTYLDRHAHGNTTFADLLVELERASGRDLQDWATAWLRTPGTSTLRTVVADGGVAVRQESDVLREHRVGVGLYDEADGGLRLRTRLAVTVAGASTPLPLAADDLPDLLLVNDGDLTFAKLRFDDRSLATVRTDLRRLSDPLARALCWAALWDATRDAELPAADLVTAVLAGVDGEHDPSVVETLLAQARTAAVLYSPDSEPLLRAMADASHDAAVSAAPGSDLQLVRLRAFAAAASPDRAPALRSVLDGGQVPDGVEVDTELRWLLLQRLCALGEAGEADVDAELARDDTAAGARAALTARAARPDAAAKQRAFQAAVADASLSSHEAQALAAGFWQPGQDDLCRPYVSRYVAAVPRLWAERSPHAAQALTRLLFPSTVVAQDVLDDVDALLATDLVPPARRVVLEQRDDLARGVRARDAAARGQGMPRASAAASAHWR